jgi:hypothetical protein
VFRRSNAASACILSCRHGFQVRLRDRPPSPPPAIESDFGLTRTYTKGTHPKPFD